MIVSIMQPAYLPWLGYFSRIQRSDCHIVLDDVEIDRCSRTKFANRNKIRTKDGWCWLTVPIKTKGMLGSLHLNRLKIVEEDNWSMRHWKAIQHNYSKAPFFLSHAPYFERIYKKRWVGFIDLVREITGYMLDAFDIRTPILYSSEMEVEGEKDELILNLCRSVNATSYLSGPFGRDYIDEAKFSDEGIGVEYDDYRCPTYQQQYPAFVSNLSAIDLLLNHGPRSSDLLKSSNLHERDPGGGIK